MRSSKKRSRSNQNRPRSLGNIVNRVFDSSGPEGKVRGTPQQIIEKYNALARDAQLSNDRVAAENFLQHAEHYTRLLAEAQRELAAEQEARQQHNGHQNGFRERDQRDGRERGDRERSEGYRSETPRGEPREPWPEDAAQPVLDMDAGNGVIDLDADGVEVGLVELPEMSEAPQFGADDVQNEARSDARAERKPRGDAPRNQIRGERRERTPRRERAPRAEAAEAPAAVETPAAPAAPAAVEADAGEAKPRRERRPRKPRVAADGADTPSAAE